MPLKYWGDEWGIQPKNKIKQTKKKAREQRAVPMLGRDIIKLCCGDWDFNFHHWAEAPSLRLFLISLEYTGTVFKWAVQGIPVYEEMCRGHWRHCDLNGFLNRRGLEKWRQAGAESESPERQLSSPDLGSRNNLKPTPWKYAEKGKKHLDPMFWEDISHSSP